MVHILPPADWSATLEPTSGMGPAESAPALALSNSISDATFDMVSPAGLPEPVPVSVSPSPLPPDTSQPPAHSRAAWSWPLWMWGAVAGGSVLVGGVIAMLLPSGDSEQATGVRPPFSAQAAETPPTSHEEPSAQGDADTINPASGDTAAHAASRSQPDAAEARSAPLPTPLEAPPAVAAEPAAKPAASIARLERAATPAAVLESSPVESSTTISKAPVLTIDPLDFDPARLTTFPPTPKDAPAESSIQPDEAPPAQQEAAQAPPEQAPPPAEPPLVWSRRGPAPELKKAPIDNSARLIRPIDSFKATDLPLGQFIESMAALAGVSITVDPVALELTGNSALEPLGIEADATTVEKLLQQVLSKQRLALSEHDGHLKLALPDADERRTNQFDVGDLASDATQVAALIERFVVPETWRAAGGSGSIEVTGTKLRLDNTLAARREALIFCERLRRARGLAIRSRYPSGLLRVESPYKEMSATLDEPTTFTLLPWSRLDDAIDLFSELSGLHMIVDWAALADVDFGPGSLIACAANERTWNNALTEVLQPLGLGWWAVSDDTIQITTLDALSQIQRVEFHRLPEKLRRDFASADALTDAIRQQLEKTEAASVALSDLHYDEASHRLIVLGTPDVHRHLSRVVDASE